MSATRVDDERRSREFGDAHVARGWHVPPTPAEERPPTDRDWSTAELPATPQRVLPDPGRALGRGARRAADARCRPRHRPRRVQAAHRPLPAVARGPGGERRRALHGDRGRRPRRAVDVPAVPRRIGRGRRRPAASHTRFRTWKEDLRDASRARLIPTPGREPVRRAPGVGVALRPRAAVPSPALARAHPRDRRRRADRPRGSTSRAAPACRRSRSRELAGIGGRASTCRPRCCAPARPAPDCALPARARRDAAVPRRSRSTRPRVARACTGSTRNAFFAELHRVLRPGGVGRAVRPLLHRRDGRRARVRRLDRATRSSATRSRRATRRSAIRAASSPPASRSVDDEFFADDIAA